MNVNQRRRFWIVGGQDFADAGIPPIAIWVATPILYAARLVQAGTRRGLASANQPQLMLATRRVECDRLKRRIVCESNVGEQKDDGGGDDTNTDR